MNKYKYILLNIIRNKVIINVRQAMLIINIKYCIYSS